MPKFIDLLSFTIIVGGGIFAKFRPFFPMRVPLIERRSKNILFSVHFPDPDNKPLLNGERYAVFVRGYVTEDKYRTTDWYPTVTTDYLSKS